MNAYLRIEIVTPTHIGADQEKFKKYGIDFFISSKDKQNVSTFFINLIDWDQLLSLMSREDLQRISSFLVNRRFNDLLEVYQRYLDLRSVYASIPFVDNLLENSLFALEDVPDVRTNIRTGLGVPLIPGSSIKGAIESVLFANVLQRNRDLLRQYTSRTSINNPAELFGKPDEGENIMRLIEITDAHFRRDATMVYPTKIYSLRGEQGDFIGAWKHQRKGNVERFDPKRFVTFYECLNKGMQSVTRITFNETVLNLSIEKNINLKHLDSLGTNHRQFVQSIFNQLNNHTIQYLKRERDFFNKYSREDEERHQIIISRIEGLLRLVNDLKKNNSGALLHIGNGSGFHGITGDWQFEDHLINSLGDNNRGMRNNRISAKTRRLLFTGDGDNFYPFGFIKLELISEDQYNRMLDDINNFNFSVNNNGNGVSLSNGSIIVIEGEQVKRKEWNFKQFQKTKTSQPEELTGRDVIPYKGKIKQGVQKIPAEIVDSGRASDGKVYHKVRLFIQDFPEDKVVPMIGYSQPIEIGKKVYVMINQFREKQGEIVEVKFEQFI